MRALRFLPFAFLAGMDGFMFFTPYAAAVLATRHLVARRRRQRARAAREVQV